MNSLSAAHVLADRAYEAYAVLDHIEASGARPIIPQKTGMPATAPPILLSTST